MKRWILIHADVAVATRLLLSLQNLARELNAKSRIATKPFMD